MKIQSKLIAFAAVLALAAGPAMALAAGNHGKSASHRHYPGPHAGLHAKAKAYGKVCNAQGALHHHVKGEKGTPFSQCVTAMAKIANPTFACKTLSHKHVKGEKGTPFSVCVKAAAQLKKTLYGGTGTGTGTTTGTTSTTVTTTT